MKGEDSQVSITQALIERIGRGDPTARDELLAHASGRLERLTRKMLGGFPGVRRWEQTDDVLQNALLRLCRSLGEVGPSSAADFFGLAALQIRRELLDLSRRYSGPHGLGTNQASVGGGPIAEAGPGSMSDTCAPDRLADWTRFHEAAGALPEEEREVFALIFYHGLSREEAAAVLGVSDRTIKRRWQAARLSLVEAFGGQPPGLG